MLSVGDHNNGTVHHYLNASRCLAHVDLRSSEEMKPVLCSAENYLKNDCAVWELFMQTYLSG